MESLLRFLLRIWIRLLAFNVLLIFLPAVGILTFRAYEQKLLDHQERSMVQQGRILAAVLGERSALDGADAERILTNMRQKFDARLRVIDPELRVLADSSVLGPKGEPAAPAEPAAEQSEPDEPETRESWIYRLGSFLYLYDRVFLPPEPPLPESELDAPVEEVRTRVVQGALDGRYSAGLAVSPQRRSLDPLQRHSDPRRRADRGGGRWCRNRPSRSSRRSTTCGSAPSRCCWHRCWRRWC